MWFLSRLRSARLCLHPAGIWIIYLPAYVSEFDDGATISSRAARKGWQGRLAGKWRPHLVFLYSIGLYTIAYPLPQLLFSRAPSEICVPESSRYCAWFEGGSCRKEAAQRACSSSNSTNRMSVSVFRNRSRKYYSGRKLRKERNLTAFY